LYSSCTPFAAEQQIAEPEKQKRRHCPGARLARWEQYVSIVSQTHWRRSMIAILFGAVLPWLLTALSAAVSSDVWKDTVPINSRRAFLLTNRTLVHSGFLSVFKDSNSATSYAACFYANRKREIVTKRVPFGEVGRLFMPFREAVGLFAVGPEHSLIRKVLEPLTRRLVK
jgi:hypothetical protein